MFEHGFEDSISSEIFIITEAILSGQIYVYRTKDRSDEEIKGMLYKQELSKVIVDESKGYRI